MATGTYIDLAGWEWTYSLECLPGGNGQCDGLDPDTYDECQCMCHTHVDRLHTVKQMQRWHEIGWALVGHPTRISHAGPTYRRTTY